MSCILYYVSVFGIKYFSLFSPSSLLYAHYPFRRGYCNAGPVHDAWHSRNGAAVSQRDESSDLFFHNIIYVYNTRTHTKKNALRHNGRPLVTQRGHCQLLLLLLLLPRLYGRPSLGCPRGEERVPPTRALNPTAAT